MPDYKEMYLKLFRASEAAVELLIAAQRKAEKNKAFLPPPCYNSPVRKIRN